MAESKLQEELLHRLADGDLGAEEEEHVRTSLATDLGAQQQLKDVQKLGVLMRASGEVLQSQVDPDALFARIEAGIAADVGPAAANGRAAMGLEDSAEPSLLERWFGHRTWLPLAGALAVAGAVLMTVYRPISPGEIDRLPTGPAPEQVTPEPEASGPRAEGRAPRQATEATTQAAARTGTGAAGSSEVVQVDFGERAGTVFDVALSDGSSTAVIWINDEL